MMSNIQTNSIMTSSITFFASGLSILVATVLLPMSVLAQALTPTAPSPQQSSILNPILVDAEGYPLLYNNTNVGTTTISSAPTTARIAGDDAPNNPMDVLIGDPQDLTNTHTRVDDEGRVMSTVVSSCPKLMVDVNVPFLQSCISSAAILAYCNHGGETAYDAYVEITLDSNLVLDSASLAYVALGPHSYRFDVGTIPSGLCGNIDLHLTTACDPDLLGVLHCIDAHIFPDTLCTAVQNAPLLEVGGECLGNALKFRVTNHGTPLATSHQVQYIIIDDHLIAGGQRLVLQQGVLQIGRQGTFSTTVPITIANHMDYKMEVRDAQNAIIAICHVDLCSPITQNLAVTSDYYVHNFWNGSPLPFADRGCAVNGKTVVDASIGNSGTVAIASEGNNNTTATADDVATVDDAHLQTGLTVQVAPNPMQQQAIISLEGADEVVYQFELYSITGQLVRTLAITGNTQTYLERENLPAGLYVYRVSAKGVPLQEGKIIMQ